MKRGLERLISDATLANLPTLSDDELQTTLEQLRELEHEVSVVPQRAARGHGEPRARPRPAARGRPGLIVAPTPRGRGRGETARSRGVHPGPAPPRPAVAAQAQRAGRHLEPVPEPDRTGAAQAERRDPPGDRPRPADLGRDAVRPGRDPRRARRRARTSSPQIQRDPTHHRAPEAGAGRHLPVVPARARDARSRRPGRLTARARRPAVIPGPGPEPVSGPNPSGGPRGPHG